MLGLHVLRLQGRQGDRAPAHGRGPARGAVKIANPVPGDLVFFGNPATHVGIYAGNGMMYDSPHTGEVSRYRKIYSSSVTYGRY
ncbi:MAG: C40 family peptidase [Actinomycetales bacterium]|nr:C40 family peptidase [Candidatus Phosphoribacter baldrii]